MAEAAKKRVLRIGIIQGGKAVEERLIRRPKAITIGQGPRNTFIIPIPQLPKSSLRNVGENYRLVFDETMDGRVSVGSEIIDLNGAARSAA